MIAVQVAVGVLIAFAVIKIFPLVPLKAYRIFFDIVSLICSAVAGAVFWSYIFENPNVLDIGTAVILMSMWLGVTVSIHVEEETIECLIFILLHFILFSLVYFVSLVYYNIELRLAGLTYFNLNFLLSIIYCFVIEGKKIPYISYFLALSWATLFGAIVLIMLLVTIFSYSRADGDLLNNNIVFFILSFVSLFSVNLVCVSLAHEGVRWSKFRL